MTAPRPSDPVGKALSEIDSEYTDLAGAFAQPDSPFTEAQQAEIRRIAIEIAVAASRVQAAQECCQVIDRTRVTAKQVSDFLSGSDAGPIL